MKGFKLTFGITIFMSSLLVFIPLASVLAYSLRLSPKAFWEIISANHVRNAFLTSIGCSFVAALINCFFGLILAWTLVRYDFGFRTLLVGLIELPFALPTAVAGITLSKMYADTGIPGRWLAKAGIHVAYTHLGNALYSADRAAWEQVYGGLDERVLRDFAANRAYWKQFETPVQKASNTVYEGFLQSYDQELGLKSYGACVDLLVSYYYDSGQGM